MLFAAASTPMATALVLFVSFLLILSGRAKKRLELRSPICPICHHERKSCICHWL